MCGKLNHLMPARSLPCALKRRPPDVARAGAFRARARPCIAGAVTGHVDKVMVADSEDGPRRSSTCPRPAGRSRGQSSRIDIENDFSEPGIRIRELPDACDRPILLLLAQATRYDAAPVSLRPPFPIELADRYPGRRRNLTCRHAKRDTPRGARVARYARRRYAPVSTTGSCSCDATFVRRQLLNEAKIIHTLMS